MSKFFITILVGLLKDEDVQAFLIKAAREVVGGVIAEKVLPVLPVALGLAVKEFGDLIPGVQGIKSGLESAERVRHGLNELIPDRDIGIAPLDDLIDFWRPRDN